MPLPAITIAPTAFPSGSPLTTDERDSLADQEKIIHRGLRTFVEVGNALMAIRDNRLYREEFRSFDNYLEARWKLSRSHVSRLISGAAVASELLRIGNISDAVPLPAPTALSQVVPYIGLEPDAQRQAYAAAVQASGGGVPTAKAALAAAQVVRGQSAILKAAPLTEVEKARAEGFIPVDAVVVERECGEDAPPSEQKQELDDDEWLATIPARWRLSDQVLERFDADALNYRRYEMAIAVLIAEFRPGRLAAKLAGGGKAGRWTDRLSKALWQEDPTRWTYCDHCEGHGRVFGAEECDRCYGHGYIVPVNHH